MVIVSSHVNLFIIGVGYGNMCHRWGLWRVPHVRKVKELTDLGECKGFHSELIGALTITLLRMATHSRRRH